MSPKKLSPEIIDQLVHGADEGDLIASGLEDYNACPLFKKSWKENYH